MTEPLLTVVSMDPLETVRKTSRRIADLEIELEKAKAQRDTAVVACYHRNVSWSQIAAAAGWKSANSVAMALRRMNVPLKSELEAEA